MPKRKPSQAETLFHMHMNELDLCLLPEYRFHPERKWRFDFVIARHPTLKKVAFEIEGGVSKYAKFHPEWKTMRHQSGSGFQRDCEKYRVAESLDWKVFRFTKDDVFSGRAKEFVREWLNKVTP